MSNNSLSFSFDDCFALAIQRQAEKHNGKNKKQMHHCTIYTTDYSVEVSSTFLQQHIPHYGRLNICG